MTMGHPLLLTGHAIAPWMPIAYYGFWVALPGLLRWILNVGSDRS